MTRQLKAALRLVWLISVVVFLVLFGVRNAESILEAGRQLPLFVLFASLILVVVAKMLLVVVMRSAAVKFAVDLSLSDAYCIYHQSQLGKYIPGSVWHFVGRASMLRDRGAPTSSIRDSIAAEHLWVLSSAVMFSMVFLLSLIFPWSGEGSSQQFDELTIPTWPLIVAVVAVAVGAIGIGSRRRSRRWMTSLLPDLRVIPLLVGVWFALGAALWITALPFTSAGLAATQLISGYALAYLVGFLVPFAPAGLGIREAILVVIMAPYVGTEVAILLAAINRVLYFAVELILVVPCPLIDRRRTLVEREESVQ